MSLQSMTGYGSAEYKDEQLELSVELKSVNHRFLDINPKLPNSINSLESEITAEIKSKLKRGRVDLFVNVSRTECAERAQLSLNEELYKSYLGLAQQALHLSGAKKFKDIDKLVFSLLQKRDVVEVTAKSVLDEELDLKEPVIEAVKLALADLVQMRTKEGESLEKEIKSQLGTFSEIISKIEQDSEFDADAVKNRLSEKLARLITDVEIEPQRLAQEVAIIADKVDITEEIVRLRSHLEQYSSLIADSNTGKKLEFLLQEMLREANTIGSKTQNPKVTNLVVDAKATLEKLREQVANVE